MGIEGPKKRDGEGTKNGRGRWVREKIREGPGAVKARLVGEECEEREK